MANCTNKTPSFEMTWGSSTSSGYCSEEESDSEFEQYFTARTSFFPKTKKAVDTVKQVRGIKSINARPVTGNTPCVLVLHDYHSIIHVKPIFMRLGK